MPSFEFYKRGAAAEKPDNKPVAKTVDMIGLETGELEWVRLLIALLRHPDPVMGRLACEALLYAQAAASDSGLPGMTAAPAARAPHRVSRQP